MNNFGVQNINVVQYMLVRKLKEKRKMYYFNIFKNAKRLIKKMCEKSQNPKFFVKFYFFCLIAFAGKVKNTFLVKKILF